MEFYISSVNSTCCYEVTQPASGSGSGHLSGAIGPLFVVLSIITVLGAIAGIIGRVCNGRHWGGNTEHDFEGWVERRCASCIDGDIETGTREEKASEAPPAAEMKPAEEAPPAAAEAPAAAEPPAAEEEVAAAPEAAPAPEEAAPKPPEPEGGGDPAQAPGITETAVSQVAVSCVPNEALVRFPPMTPYYMCSCHVCCREGLFE